MCILTFDVPSRASTEVVMEGAEEGEKALPACREGTMYFLKREYGMDSLQR